MASRSVARRAQGVAALASLAGALCLASCALDAPPPVGPPETVQASLPPPEPREPPPRPTRKPPVPTPHVAEPIWPTEPIPEVDPQRVIGLDENSTTDWLGEPNARTEAPPATIWRYTSADCEVDLYFYLDLQHKVMRALHYEVRGNDGIEQRPGRCFQQLVDEHRQRSRTSSANRDR